MKTNYFIKGAQWIDIVRVIGRATATSPGSVGPVQTTEFVPSCEIAD